MSTRQLKKITVKDVTGLEQKDLQKMMLDKGSYIELFQIFGVCSSEETLETQYGIGHRLYGQFEAVNVLTGESVESRQAILPNFIGAEIAAMKKQSEFVKFAFVVGIVPNKSTIYEYTVKELLNQAATSMLADIKKQAQANLLASK